LLLWIVGQFLDTAPVANEEIRSATVLIIAMQATRALLLAGAAIIFATVRSLICAAIIFGSVQSLVLIWYLESRFPGFWHSFNWSMLRRQVSYAIPLGAAATLLTFQSDLHNYFISNRFTPAMFAVYSFGTLQIPLMGLLQEATNTVLITKISLLQQQEKTGE